RTSLRGHTPRTGTGSKPLPPSTRRRSSASLAFWKKYGRSTERSSSSRRFRLPPTLPSFHKHHQGRPLPLLFRAATCAARPFDRLILIGTRSRQTIEGATPPAAFATVRTSRPPSTSTAAASTLPTLKPEEPER